MTDQVRPEQIDVVNLLAVLATLGGCLPPAMEGLPGIYSGTGAPTFSAPAGSLYLRQNAALSVPYVNTSASSPGATWTAITVP